MPQPHGTGLSLSGRERWTEAEIGTSSPRDAGRSEVDGCAKIFYGMDQCSMESRIRTERSLHIDLVEDNRGKELESINEIYNIAKCAKPIRVFKQENLGLCYISINFAEDISAVYRTELACVSLISKLETVAFCLC